MIYSFDPIVNSKSKVLILGTMPGEKSLSDKQYYAHPRNSFWQIISQILQIPKPDLYQQKVQMLLDSHIALWDVLHCCNRQGSGDDKIEDPTANNFSLFFNQYRNIKIIFFNGGNAQKLFHRFLKNLSINITMICLPSTSPANARYTLQHKMNQWQKILDYI